MVGKITLAAALLIGTAALAQQPPANPSPPPSQAPSTQNPSQSQIDPAHRLRRRPGLGGLGSARLRARGGEEPGGIVHEQGAAGEDEVREGGLVPPAIDHLERINCIFFG